MAIQYPVSLDVNLKRLREMASGDSGLDLSFNDRYAIATLLARHDAFQATLEEIGDMRRTCDDWEIAKLAPSKAQKALKTE